MSRMSRVAAGVTRGGGGRAGKGGGGGDYPQIAQITQISPMGGGECSRGDAATQRRGAELDSLKGTVA